MISSSIEEREPVHRKLEAFKVEIYDMEWKIYLVPEKVSLGQEVNNIVGER